MLIELVLVGRSSFYFLQEPWAVFDWGGIKTGHELALLFQHLFMLMWTLQDTVGPLERCQNGYINQYNWYACWYHETAVLYNTWIKCANNVMVSWERKRLGDDRHLFWRSNEEEEAAAAVRIFWMVTPHRNFVSSRRISSESWWFSSMRHAGFVVFL